jgi:lipase (class 3)
MDLNKAILYGQLVNEAYKVPPSDLSNRAGTIVTVERGPNKTTFEVIASIYANDLAKDPTNTGPRATVSIGFVLCQADAGEAVIAIRGTEGFLEWFQDAKIGTEKCPFPGGAGETEDGFTDMYKSFAVNAPGRSSVTASLATIFGARQVNSLTICGHSLGGALATLQALDVAANSKFKNPTVYTYASPRTGDAQFASTYNRLVPNTFRIANRADLVPKLPLPPPYEHVLGLYQVSAIQIFPPAVLVEPNPLCEHVLETYLHLLSKAAGGEVLHLKPGCATPGGPAKLWKHLGMEFGDVEKLLKDVR